MSKARLVITAVTVEKRPVSEVARDYEVARSWVYVLLERYRAEGEAAFEPRSRRPKTSPAAISGAAARAGVTDELAAADAIGARVLSLPQPRPTP
jgi:transposase-like protein